MTSISLPIGFPVKVGDTIYVPGQTRIGSYTVTGYYGKDGTVYLTARKEVGTSTVIVEVLVEDKDKTWFTDEKQAHIAQDHQDASNK